MDLEIPPSIIALVGALGTILGFVGGRRAQIASATVAEATAAQISAAVYSQVTKDLGDQLRRCEEGRERDQARIEELETCRDQLRDQVAELLGRVALLEHRSPLP